MSNVSLKELAEIVSAAPANYAVVVVPSLPVFAEEFHVTAASVNSEHLRSAISSGLPIILAAPISPSDKSAAGLSPRAVRAEIFFQGPTNGGTCAVVFDTGKQVSVRYSDAGGGIRATARPNDFWSI